MLFDDELDSSSDPLALATAALRETPIPDAPMEAIARAQRIGADVRSRWILRPRNFAWAAVIGSVIIGVIFFVAMPRPKDLAFADVVRAIDQTHTFTGKLSLAMPGTGIRFNVDVFVKGPAARVDSPMFVAIFDQQGGEVVTLFPLIRQAAKVETGPTPKYFDIYSILRGFDPASQKIIGEKTVEGRKLKGLRLSGSSAASEVAGMCTFWVDPETKLPVQLEMGDANAQETLSLSDLKFDVPLDDALFDTKPPAGYTMLNDSEKSDPWKRRKFAGRVVDERGNAVMGVKVTASLGLNAFGGGTINVGEPVTTDIEGKFSIDGGSPVRSFILGFDGKTRRGYDFADAPIRLEFQHTNYLFGRLEDLNLMPPDARVNLSIRLDDGKSLAGKVVDESGKPVAGAMVEAVFGKPDDRELRADYDRKVAASADGKFEMHGLAGAPAMIQVRSLDPASPVLWGQMSIDLAACDGEVTIRARPLSLPAGTIVHTLFGMKLVDVNDELRRQLSLHDFENVMVVDAGPEIGGLGVNPPLQGDCFWLVDGVKIRDYGDLVTRLRDACERQKRGGITQFRVEALYGRKRVEDDTNGGGYLTLDESNLAELEAAATKVAGKETPR
jgi:hypothetical protein